MFSANPTLHSSLALPISPNPKRSHLTLPENYISHPSTPMGTEVEGRFNLEIEIGIFFSEEFFFRNFHFSFPLFSPRSGPQTSPVASPDTPGDSASSAIRFDACSARPAGRGSLAQKIDTAQGTNGQRSRPSTTVDSRKIPLRWSKRGEYRTHDGDHFACKHRERPEMGSVSKIGKTSKF